MTPETFAYQFRNKLKELPKISLLGLRGDRNNLNPNDLTSLYDDTIVRCIDGVLTHYQASVDPGSYYVNHPINPLGCAKLKTGLWMYQYGEHLHAHPALVQADEVTVDRLDRSGKKLCEDTGYFGVNIHSGGPEYLIGRYSAGCQIIKTAEAWKDKWQDFFLPIFAAMGIYEQKKIPYLLVDRLEAISVSVDAL